MVERLLVSDIDGTLLRNGASTIGLETLRSLIDREDPGMRLVYATGRTVDSVLDLVAEGTLPPPDAVAPLVGTEVWLPDWSAPEPAYSRRIDKGWQPDRVRATASRVAGLEIQPKQFQSQWKISYFIECERTVEEVARRLREAELRCRIIHSGERFLDLIPEKAGKRAAIEFITGAWNAPAAKVLAAGDSLNDHDMLVHPRYFGVVVGNAEDKLSARANGPNLHEAKLPFAAGVLEGAEVFEFWNHERSGEAESED